jgi:hypothetical protein
MRFCFLLLTVLFVEAQATEYTWSGMGSACGDTLNLCVNQAVAGDTVIISTNEPIHESLNNLDQPVSLIAGSGFKPVFATGHGITLYTESEQLTIQGLTFNDGYIHVINTSTDSLPTEINIIGNQVTNHSVVNAISVLQGSSSSALSVNIDFNQVSVTGSGQRGITVANAFDATYQLDARLYGNTAEFSSAAIGGFGILAYNTAAGGTYDFLISGNTINKSNGGTAILINNGDGTAAEMTVDLVSNLLNQGSLGLQSDLAPTGNLLANVYNNTVIASQWGLSLHGSNSDNPLKVNLYNNLVINNHFGINIQEPANNQILANESNLFQHNTHYRNYTINGTNAEIDPAIQVIKSLVNPRLAAGSPAIDAATFVTSGPYVDADGLYRSKQGGIDVGAFESGDQTFLHRGNGGGYTSVMNHGSINDEADLEAIHITANMTSEGGSLLTNAANTGIWYWSDAGRWNVFNQDRSTVIAAGAGFNVMRMGESANTFEHETDTSSAPLTELDSGGLNNQSEQIVQVTQHWTGAYNDHPIGVAYDDSSGRWAIHNLDGANLPFRANFNVAHQAPSKSAWIHEATAGNTNLISTELNHPLINGVPCAQLQITADVSNGTAPLLETGVHFSQITGHWNLIQQHDTAPGSPVMLMPEGARFHILVNPEQIFQCQDVIFKNGF